MSLFSATIKYRGAVPKNIKARELNLMLKEAYRLLGLHWHKVLRKKHFTHAGAREYNYAPRKGEPGSGRRFAGSYTAKKLKSKGHTLPLVFTGKSRLLTERENVSSTSKGARVRINAPGLNFKHPKSPIMMRREMTALSYKDRMILTVLLSDYVKAQLIQKQWRWPPTTVRI